MSRLLRPQRKLSLLRSNRPPLRPRLLRRPQRTSMHQHNRTMRMPGLNFLRSPPILPMRTCCFAALFSASPASLTRTGIRDAFLMLQTSGDPRRHNFPEQIPSAAPLAPTNRNLNARPAGAGRPHGTGGRLGADPTGRDGEHLGPRPAPGACAHLRQVHPPLPSAGERRLRAPRRPRRPSGLGLLLQRRNRDRRRRRRRWWRRAGDV